MARSTERGFSLAELLAAIGIASLVLSLGVPSYTAFTKDARQVTSANELLYDLHFARDLAVTRYGRAHVCPSSSGTGCDGGGWQDGWIVFLDEDTDGAVDAGEVVERVSGQDLSDLEIAMATGEFGAGITYRPNGRAMGPTVADNTGEFVMCDDRGAAHARTLIIELSGRPRVSRESADGSTPVCP